MFSQYPLVKPTPPVRLEGANLTIAIVPDLYFLYAEDDQEDQILFKDIMAKYHPEIEIMFCEDGQQLIHYLDSLLPGDHYPGCIILDMNMPLWGGLRTLHYLKQNLSLPPLKVVIFTTSSSPLDEQRSLSLGADAFVTKPVSLAGFATIVEQFAEMCKHSSIKK